MDEPKINTLSGPLFRNGGFYFETGQGQIKVLPPSGYLLFHCLVHYIQILVKVYQDLDGYCYCEADVFLSEARIKVFKKTGRLIVIEELNKVYTVIIFTVKIFPISVDCSSFIARLFL